jgi:hypothetical protein
MVALGWCIWMISPAFRQVTMEIFIVVVAVWSWTGSIAAMCGLAAWIDIRSSGGSLRGRWMAILGMILASVFPVLLIADEVRRSIQ